MAGPDPKICPLDHLALRGERAAPALVADGRTIAFGEFDEQVGRIASALLAAGLAPGDRVASWMGKTRLACLLPLAAARAGLVHVPINPVLRRGQTAHILADSGARLLIANQARLESLADSDRGDAAVVAQENWRDGDEDLAASRHDPGTLAALFYTSGSTGRPKGVMLTHANLWLGAISVAHYLGLGPRDRTLCVLPLAFDYGQSQLLATWAAGGCAIAFDYLLPGDVVRAARRHDVTVLAGVPPLWHQLAEADWSGGEGRSLQTLTNSGGHLPLPLVRKLRDLFPDARLHLMYGLTEAFRSTSLDPALVDLKPDSVGTAIPFAEVKIARPDGSEVAPGEEGELVHAGPLVALGYWRDPERTAERFRDGPNGVEVWSGDRAIRGEDGLIRIRGRDDAIIKTSGNRVSPTEIEEAALASGAVAQSVALGMPDAELGQAIVLVAEPRGEDADERLRAYFVAELPAFMRPKRIIWRQRLPIGANGKLERTAIQAQVQEECT